MYCPTTFVITTLYLKIIFMDDIKFHAGNERLFENHMHTILIISNDIGFALEDRNVCNIEVETMKI